MFGLFGGSKRRSSVDESRSGQRRSSLREESRRASIDAAVSAAGLKDDNSKRVYVVGSGKSTPATYEHSNVIKTNRRPSNEVAFREAERRVAQSNRQKLESQQMADAEARRKYLQNGGAVVNWSTATEDGSGVESASASASASNSKSNSKSKGKKQKKMGNPNLQNVIPGRASPASQKDDFEKRMDSVLIDDSNVNVFNVNVAIDGSGILNSTSEDNESAVDKYLKERQTTMDPDSALGVSDVKGYFQRKTVDLDTMIGVERGE